MMDEVDLVHPKTWAIPVTSDPIAPTPPVTEAPSMPKAESRIWVVSYAFPEQ
jgi:hypothetical protein